MAVARIGARDNSNGRVSLRPPGSATLHRFTVGLDYRPPAGAMNTQAFGVNDLYAVPFDMWAYQNFDMMSADVTALGVLSAGVVGIYNDNGNGYPSSLRAITFPNMAFTTTGRKDSQPTSVFALTPDLYWLALLTTVTSATLRALNNGLAPLPCAFASSQTYNAWKTTLAGGTVILPNTFPAGATGFNNGPALSLRAAT